MSTHNGELISELGVKRYMIGFNAAKFSSINPLQTQKQIEKKWQECNFGCHTPSYRVMRHETTFHELLNRVDAVSPPLAGVIDGIHHQTIRQAELVGSGVARTAEGLGANGQETFQTVGAENYAVYDFLNVNVTKLINADLNLTDNPLFQLVFSVIDEYVSLIPESALQEMIEDGALIMSDGIDRNMVSSVLRSVLGAAYEELDESGAVDFLNSKGQRFIGKQIGKRLARGIAAVIAVKITKKLMTEAKNDMRIKRRIVKMRQSMRAGKSGLATALIILIKANGWLGVAAEESRQLKQNCPTLWRRLRNDMGGYDMILFLIKGYIKEYLDRLAVLEKNPDLFVSLMAALIRSGKTQEIFFPR